MQLIEETDKRHTCMTVKKKNLPRISIVAKRGNALLQLVKGGDVSMRRHRSGKERADGCWVHGRVTGRCVQMLLAKGCGSEVLFMFPCIFCWADLSPGYFAALAPLCYFIPFTTAHGHLAIVSE